MGLQLYTSPEEATVLFLLFNVLGWWLFFVRDAWKKRFLAREISTPRLLTSNIVAMSIGWLYYNYVPGATNLFFLIAHGLYFVTCPIWIYHRNPIRYMGYILLTVILLCIAVGSWFTLSGDNKTFIPLTLYSILIPVLAIFFKRGGRQWFIQYYRKPNYVPRKSTYKTTLPH